MSRNHQKLRVFQIADDLIPIVYRITRTFPVEERYTLQSQLRRASVSAATNIVEGCARDSTREYLRFLNIALGSTVEAEYLLQLAVRLQLVQPEAVADCLDGYNALARSLQNLTRAFQSVSRR